jgi:hypothetical protein
MDDFKKVFDLDDVLDNKEKVLKRMSQFISKMEKRLLD